MKPNVNKPQEQIDYDEALKNIKVAAVRVELRRHGVDPYALSQKDFDEIRRLYSSMEQVDAMANGKINAIEQEAHQEKTKMGQELSELLKKALIEQHPMPPVPDKTGEQPLPQAETEEVPGEEPV